MNKSQLSVKYGRRNHRWQGKLTIIQASNKIQNKINI